MTTLTKAEVSRAFDEAHAEAMRDPVEIVSDGRPSAYLVSAQLFDAMWSSYRRAMFVGDLTDDDMAAMEAARVPPEHDRPLDDGDDAG